MRKRGSKAINYAVFDFETDPFKENRIPKPFAVGVYDGADLWTYWGDDCVDKFIEYIDGFPSGTIFYAHNGGKFDFHFIIKFFRGKIRIVNRRILQATIITPSGNEFEFRDSFAILPVPLAKFNKDEIDYKKFERNVRNRHRHEIVKYMGNDCVYLWDAVKVFIDEFDTGRGIKLTMASAAMSALKRFHTFECLNQGDDELIRPYYFGGRNQCFKTGIIKGNFTLFDVNSMYPFAMKSFLHPIGAPSDYGGSKINRHTYFAKVIGKNYGALPVRMPDGSLSFTADVGTFFASIHELNAAEETGTFKIIKVLETIDFRSVGNFAEFVDHFYAQRMKAVEMEGKDGAHVTLYKLISNGAYGKFAQNPNNFFDYIITDNEIPAGDDWLPADEIYNYIIWEKPTEEMYGNPFYNVATGASITGASRGLLLRGISRAVSPLYCDTDSIICERLDLPQGNKLGEWKIEATGNLLAVAGKKTYALMDGDKCVKKASKGVRLTHDQIIRAANGDIVEFENPVPNFQLRIGGDHRKKVSTGVARFIKRKIRKTG